MIHEGNLNGVDNMRLDEALLVSADSGVPGVRVYGWDGVWVSVGRFQSEVTDLVDPATTRWVRRPTGGKAVLHGHDLTVGLAIPFHLLHECDPRSVISAYRSAVRPIIDALVDTGVDARLAADTHYASRGPRSGDCFAYASPNDVVEATSGRKLCGCALRLTQRAVLLQASIPTSNPLVAPDSVICHAHTLIPVCMDTLAFCHALTEALGEIW